MSWVTDGSDHLSSQGNVLTCRKGTGSFPTQALWDEGSPLTSGEGYWKIHLTQLKDGGAVGFTTKEKLKPGYGNRGLQYNGNLTNAIAGLEIGFGPYVKEGDILGVLASFEGSNLKIYFDINNQMLGLGFDVPADCMSGGIYPLASFNGDGSAPISKATPPTDRSRFVPTYEGIEGPWKLVSMNGGPIVAPAGGHSITPTLNLTRKPDGVFEAHMKVVNNMGGRLTFNNGNWTGSHCTSTMMMGPDYAMNIERIMGELVAEPTRLEVQNGRLLFIGNAKEGSKTTEWERYVEPHKTITGNPFN